MVEALCVAIDIAIVFRVTTGTITGLVCRLDLFDLVVRTLRLRLLLGCRVLVTIRPVTRGRDLVNRDGGSIAGPPVAESLAKHSVRGVRHVQFGSRVVVAADLVEQVVVDQKRQASLGVLLVVLGDVVEALTPEREPKACVSMVG
jgi:hypothetical protein